jgi:hypothetical protein
MPEPQAHHQRDHCTFSSVLPLTNARRRHETNHTATSWCGRFAPVPVGDPRQDHLAYASPRQAGDRLDFTRWSHNQRAPNVRALPTEPHRNSPEPSSC